MRAVGRGVVEDRAALPQQAFAVNGGGTPASASMKRHVAPDGCHGAPDDGRPRLAVETEAAVESIAQPLRIGERERNQCRGDVAVHPLEDDADLLWLVGQLVGRCEGEHRLLGNPIADLAGFGHDLIASALGAIAAISGVAVGSGLLESIPFFGKGLDAFESVWRVTDGFVSTILGLMLIAGAVLSFVLPALPFIRFLFGVFGWLLNVVEAVLAVTVFAAAHVTRGQDRGLAVPATRQGWLFLPGLILRPPLMLFGLILGYFVFLAAIGLLNAIWLPQLRDAGASDGLGPIGFLAMLTLYVMICYALMNGAFKLIDLLPSAVLDWIGGRAGGDDDGAGRLAGAVTGGIARAGSGRLTGRLRGGAGSGG